VGSKNQLYEGFYAFRMLTVRLPLLAPLALICWLPGVSVIGVAAYQTVAKKSLPILRMHMKDMI